MGVDERDERTVRRVGLTGAVDSMHGVWHA